MGSGVIYAGIIVLWAAYFIPRWLKRHEELSETRSVDRFSRAMGILSRRDPTPDQRYVVMPKRPDKERRGWRKRRRHERRRRLMARGSRRPVVTADRRRAVRIAIRRRRIFAGLLLVTVVVAAAVPLSPLPWWSLIVVAVLDLAYLVHLRVQARRRRELYRTRLAVRRRTRARLRRLDSAERILASRRDLDSARVEEEARVAGATWAEDESGMRGSDDGWQPTPVPLPTYVSKPKAPRPPRPFDLSSGDWREQRGGSEPLLSEEPFDQTAAAAAPAEPAATAGPALLEDDAAELEAIIERRRAVND